MQINKKIILTFFAHLLLISSIFFGVEYSSNLDVFGKISSLLLGGGGVLALLLFSYDPPGFFFFYNKEKIIYCVGRVIPYVVIRSVIAWVIVVSIFAGGISVAIVDNDMPKILVVYWFLCGGAISSVLSNLLMFR